MKCITRTIEITKYYFGYVDIGSGNIDVTKTIETAEPLKLAEVNAICKADGVSFIQKATEEHKYSLPVNEFVEAAKAYASRVKSELNAQYGDNTESNTEEDQ